MPTSIHPHIRSLQEALENDFMIPKIDTPLSTQYKAEEASGARIKVLPKVKIYSNNRNYDPS